LNAPYTFRIMACLPNEQPVELFRARRHYQQADWEFWCRDLLDRWHCWVETRTPDKKTVTDRPRIKHHSGSAKHAIHLTHEQKQEAGI